MQEACLFLSIHPILSGTDSYNEWHPQPSNPLHLAFYQSCGSRLLGLRHLENQLVMDLEQHPRLEPRRRQSGVDAYHGDLDQVGRGPL